VGQALSPAQSAKNLAANGRECTQISDAFLAVGQALSLRGLPVPPPIAHAPHLIVYLEIVTAEQKTQLSEVIWVDPERMSGTPCFKGTRVPVQCLIDYIQGNSTLEEFFEDYPSVSREQVTRFLELAKEQLVECVSS
jgi:uncharacterized protein (DUF433 family)